MYIKKPQNNDLPKTTEQNISKTFKKVPVLLQGFI